MPARLLLQLIGLYQRHVSGHLLVECNFEPCCSEYMKAALRKHGVVHGLARGIARIRRCNDRNLVGRKHDPLETGL